MPDFFRYLDHLPTRVENRGVTLLLPGFDVESRP